MKRRLLFIYNAHSGQGRIRSILCDMIDVMVKGGFEVTVYPTQGAQDATQKVLNDGKGYDRIICSGGDGTLDEVVTGILSAGLDIPVGYIPMGTTNDFASSIGVDVKWENALKIAVGDNIFSSDVGGFRDDYFVYVAAFGLFTEASYTTNQELKNVLGHAAYVLEGIRQLADIPVYHMEISDGTNSWDGTYIFGMITNSISVGGIKGLIPGEVKLDDGLFEVTLVRVPQNPIELSEILAFFTNFNRETSMVDSFQTSGISISSDDKVSWTLDGEFGGEHNLVRIESIPKALKIFVE